MRMRPTKKFLLALVLSGATLTALSYWARCSTASPLSAVDVGALLGQAESRGNTNLAAKGRAHVSQVGAVRHSSTGMDERRPKVLSEANETRAAECADYLEADKTVGWIWVLRGRARQNKCTLSHTPSPFHIFIGLQVA